MGTSGWGRRVWLCLFFAILSGLATAKEYEVGGTYKVLVEDVLPTQFAVGYMEVEIRTKKILRAIEEGTFEELREEESGRAVIGPNGKLYLIDGHHFACALLKAEKKKMFVDIEADYSDLTWPAFWEKMREKGFCNLFDENGEAAAVKDLPKSIRALRDDRYRALAWLVRKCEGYKKLEVPFQEFRWANHFRTRIRFSGDGYESWKTALERAMALARGEDASDLPGYHGKKGDCKKMLEYLAEIEKAAP